MSRTWKVLVPTNLYDQQIVDMYHEAPGIDIEYALPANERVFGGGPLGPYEQRRKVESIVWDRIAEFDVIGAMAGTPFVTAALLDRAPDLMAVFIASAGYDSIDVDAATARGIAVVNAAGNNVVPVSEQAMGLLLALSRKIAYLDRIAHRERRSLHVSEVGSFPGVLRDKTIGLVGFGRIGRAVAGIATAGFGMRAVTFDPYADRDAAAALGVTVVDTLDELLRASEVVSVHVPLSPETRHTISQRELGLMKPGAFLLNTSRGGTVDTDALVDALESGHLGGAGLDVTDPEPLPPDHPLHRLENVVLTPHSAGVAPEAIVLAHRLAAESVIDARNGIRPSTLVNDEVWPTYLKRWEQTETS